MASDAGGTTPPPGAGGDGGLRISDAAARAGLSARTLRYYEELGLLTPSAYTAGGERRYGAADLERLARIVELRDVLGMNLDEIRGFLETETRLDEVRQAYRARRGATTPSALAQQRDLLEEAQSLNVRLAEALGAKIDRMEAFRSRLLASAQRCRDALADM